MTLARIVSGGQTGADQGAWDAAIYCDLPYGGWVPKGRIAENGVIPAKYEGFQETTSKDYLIRTRANVVDSDATVVFCYGPPTGGSARTVTFAETLGRPHLAVDLRQPRAAVVDAVARWIQTTCPSPLTLNVAGTRESGAPGIRSVVCARLVDVISRVNGRLFYPLEDSVRSSRAGWGVPEL